jgi:hypothetical protein
LRASALRCQLPLARLADFSRFVQDAVPDARMPQLDHAATIA